RRSHQRAPATHTKDRLGRGPFRLGQHPIAMIAMAAVDDLGRQARELTEALENDIGGDVDLVGGGGGMQAHDLGDCLVRCGGLSGRHRVDAKKGASIFAVPAIDEDIEASGAATTTYFGGLTGAPVVRQRANIDRSGAGAEKVRNEAANQYGGI